MEAREVQGHLRARGGSRKAIKAKSKGRAVHEPAEVEDEAEVHDLMAALRASVEATGKRKRRRSAA